METLQNEKDNIKTEIRNLNTQNDAQKEQIQNFSTEKNEIELQLKQVQQELKKGNQTCSRCRDLKKECDALKGDNDAKRIHLDEVHRKKKKYFLENQKLKKTEERLNKEVDKLTTQLEKLKNAEPDISKKNAFGRERKKCNALENEIRNYKRLLSESDEKRKTLEGAIKEKDTQITRALEKVNAQLKKSESIIDERKKQCESYHEDIAKLGREKDEIERELKETTERLGVEEEKRKEEEEKRKKEEKNRKEEEEKRKEALKRKKDLEEALLHPKFFVPRKESFCSHGVLQFLNGLKHSERPVAKRSSDAEGNARDIFYWEKNKTSGTNEIMNSWWRVDLGQHYLLAITHYALRHGNKEGESVLSQWRIEGSNDGKDFEEIKTYERTDDPRGVTDKRALGRWSVICEEGAFRYFRIFQTNKNSSGKYGIYLSGLELYGVLFKV